MAKAKAKPKTAKAKSAPKKSARPYGTIENLIEEIQFLMAEFATLEDAESNLTTAERRRLIGAGVRNYGFIDKAFDIARDNPDFMPSQLHPQQIWKDMHDFEDMRQLVWVLEKFLQMANEAMLIRGDKIFRDALFIYNNLRELSRARVPGAQQLFEALLKFFRRRRRPGEAEPTVKELEKDFNKLIHGRADGKMVIESEMPKKTAGVRKVVDDVHKGKIAVKVTAEAEETE